MKTLDKRFTIIKSYNSNCLLSDVTIKTLLKFPYSSPKLFKSITFLQYVNGGSLDQIIISGSRPSEEFPWTDRVSMANDINEGLSYLHSRGIFHRDLTSKVIDLHSELSEILESLVNSNC